MNKFKILLSAIFLFLISDLFPQAPPYNFVNSIGGSGVEVVKSLKQDVSGNIYVLGQFENTVDFDPSPNTANLTSQGFGDIFLAKYNSVGQYQWAFNIGSSYNDSGHDLELDAAGNVYITGFIFGNADFNPSPVVSNMITVTSAPTAKLYVAKYNSAGQLMFAFGVGGASGSSSRATDLAIDASAVYVTGTFNSGGGSMDFDPGATANNLSTNSSTDAFIAKYTLAGAAVWAYSLPGAMGSTSDANGVCLDNSGNVYITGDFNSVTDFNPSPVVSNVLTPTNTNPDGFVAKYNNSGQYQWAFGFGSTIVDYGYKICSDGTDVYVTGSFAGTVDFNPSAATNNLISASSSDDAFVAKYNTLGQYQWAFRIGSTASQELGYGISMGASGNIHTIGQYANTIDLDPSASNYPLTSNGSSDIFVATYNPSGQFQWGFNLGGTSFDTPHGITPSITGGIFAFGNFQNTVDFDHSVSTATLTSNGSTDGFFARYDVCSVPSSPVNTSLVQETSICSGLSATMTAAATGTINWYNSLTSTVSLGTGTNYISPILTTGGSISNYTYYAETSTCANSPRTAFIVTVNPIPVVTISPGNSTICIGQNINLTGGGASTYSWNTGATSSNINVSPASSANYTVWGTSAAGCVNNASVSVTVNSLPVVSASVSNASICSGQNATLTGNGASTYSWNTGATSVNTTVGPTSNTTYTLWGTTNNCTNSATVSVIVNPLPSVTISTSSTVICAGKNATLTASGASTYSWSTGATTSSITVNPSSNTTYTAWGTSSAGCVNSSSVLITVNALPNVNVSSNNSPVCSGITATLTASGATTYSWNTGALTQNIAVTPASSTNYTVWGTNSNGCTNTATIVQTINPLPPVATAGNTVLCAGQTTTLSGWGATTYSWSTGATTVDIAVNPPSTTTYTVWGTNSSGCTKSATIQIIVNPLPVVTISPSTTTICTGQNAVLTGGGVSSYTWNTGSNSSNITVSPSSNSTYTLWGTNNNCTSSASISIIVNSLPVVTVSSSTNVICSGQSATLTASGASTYSWNTGATNSSIFVNPTSNTSYTVTGTNSNGCKNTTTASIGVNPLPSVLVTSSNPTICIGQSATLTANGATTYSWSTGAATSVIAINPMITTSYTVFGTDGNNCSNTATITQNVSACTEIAEADKVFVKPLRVYPNPATETLYVESDGPAQIMINDVTGKTILEKAGTGKTTFSISHLSPGIYFIQTSNGKKEKFIKQ